MSEQTQEMSETEREINALVERFKHHKINLIHPEGNEGVWAVAVSAEDQARYERDDSEGETYRARLCNQPLGWGGKKWGDEIVARTNGASRPYANAEDQTDWQQSDDSDDE